MHKNAGKGPRYSPSSSAALNADAASLDDAKGAVVRAMALLEVSLFMCTTVSRTTMFQYFVCLFSSSDIPQNENFTKQDLLFCFEFNLTDPGMVVRAKDARTKRFNSKMQRHTRRRIFAGVWHRPPTSLSIQ